MKSESLSRVSRMFRCTMFARRLLPALVGVLFVGIVACDDDDNDPIIDVPEMFALTFSGDDSFVGPHAGDAISVVVETEAGNQRASDDGVVAEPVDGEDPNPSFTFDLGDRVLQEPGSYVIKYWIDSNFGGGTEGECDAPEIDHQWAIDSTEEAALGEVSADVDIVVSHSTADLEDVCDSF